MTEVVGEAVLRFSVDRSAADDGLDGLEKDSAKTGGKAGSAFGGAFKKALKVAAVGITAALGLGTVLFKIGDQFDSLSDTIQVTTGESGKALGRLNADAEAVARRVPLAFDAIGPVIATLNQRLDLAGKPLQDLAEQFLDLQSITGEAIDVDAVTGALNQFNVPADETSKVMDRLFRVTQESGLGFNDLGSILNRQGPALKQFGFSISDSANLIGTLSKAGIDPSRTLGTLSRALGTFAKQGLAPQAALKKTTDQIGELLKAGDKAGAIDLAGKIFGTRGAAQFVAAIDSGKVSLEDLNNLTADNANTIVGTTKATEDFSEKLQLLKNRVLIQLKPIALDVFNAVGGAIERLNTSGALPAIADGIRGVADDVQPLLARGAELAGDILPRIGDVLDKAVPKVAGLATVLGKDLVTAAGDVIDIIGPLVDEAADLGQSFIEDGGLDKTIDVLTTIGDVLTSVTGFLAEHDTAVRAVLVTVGTAVALWQAWSLGMQVVSAVTKAFTVVQAALNLVLSANPIGLVVIALAAAAAGLIYAYKHSDRFRAIVDAIGHTVAKVFGGIISFFKDHWVLIVSLIGGPIVAVAIQVIKHFDDIKAGVKKAVDFVVDIPDKIADLAGRMKLAGEKFIGGLFRGILGVADKAGGVVADIASDVFDGIKGMINDAIDLINSGIPNSIGAGPVKIDLPNNPIPHLARGTSNWPGGWSWVGEEGPELVNVPRGARVLPAAQSAAAASSAAPGVTIERMTVMPHNYSEWERQVLSRARVSNLGTRRPVALAGVN